MSFRPAPTRLLVIGYSGRDFDLFPTLIAQFSHERVLWVDTKFGPEHRAHALHAMRFHGPWNELAVHFEIEPQAVAAEAAVKDRYRQIIEQHVSDFVVPAVSDAGHAVAALTGIYAAAGAHRDAARLASRWREVEDVAARIQTQLWGAHACSSLDRFVTAREFARDARRQAVAARSVAGVGRAAIADTYAATSNLWMNVAPATSAPLQFRVRQAAVLLRVIWTALVWAPLAALLAWRLRPRRADSGTRVAVAEYRFCADYLEHLIRLMSFLNTAASRQDALKPAVEFGWRRLASACASIGYTWGVFNVSKYLSRITGDFSGPQGALTTAEVMGDRVGACIAHREAALATIRRAEAAENPNADLEEARHQLRLASEHAYALRCPSLTLKVLLVMRALNKEVRVPVVEVNELLELAECEAMRRQAREIRRALCD